MKAAEWEEPICLRCGKPRPRPVGASTACPCGATITATAPEKKPHAGSPTAGKE